MIAGREKKRQKDKNAPKKPMTAYFLWFNSMRAELRVQHPTASITEISKFAGEEWKKVRSDFSIRISLTFH